MALAVVVLAHCVLIGAIVWTRTPRPRPVEHLASSPTIEVSIAEIPRDRARSLNQLSVQPRFKVIRPVIDKVDIDAIAEPGDLGRPGDKGIPATPLTEPRTPPKPSSEYVVLLAQRLAQVKRYPAAARFRRQQGTVTLYFKLDRNGRVLAWRIARSSGFEPLDAEASAMLTAVGTFPAFPASMPQANAEFLVPIEFYLSQTTRR